MYYTKYSVGGELYHHGILGQIHGVRNGPPYPLDAGDHSAAEKRQAKRGISTLASYIKDKRKKKKEEKRVKELKAKRAAALAKARETKKQKEEEKKRQAEHEAGRQQALKSGSAEDILKYQGEMTNQELQDALTRLDKERQLKAIVEANKVTTADKIDKIVNHIDRVRGWAEKGINAYNTGAKIVNTFLDEDNELPIVGADKAAKRKARAEADSAEATARKNELLTEEQKIKNKMTKQDLENKKDKERNEKEKRAFDLKEREEKSALEIREKKAELDRAEKDYKRDRKWAKEDRKRAMAREDEDRRRAFDREEEDRRRAFDREEEDRRTAFERGHKEEPDDDVDRGPKLSVEGQRWGLGNWKPPKDKPSDEGKGGLKDIASEVLKKAKEKKQKAETTSKASSSSDAVAEKVTKSKTEEKASKKEKIKGEEAFKKASVDVDALTEALLKKNAEATGTSSSVRSPFLSKTDAARRESVREEAGRDEPKSRTEKIREKYKGDSYAQSAINYVLSKDASEIAEAKRRLQENPNIINDPNKRKLYRDILSYFS